MSIPTTPATTPSPFPSEPPIILLTPHTTIAPITFAPQVFSTASQGSGNGNGNNGSSNNNTNSTLANSAALYLYTFLATLVLLLSVSAAIVIRSCVLRRRHRRMMQEAIRNGTWIPPSPASRLARVDLSKKPVLWEAYIDNKGSISYSHGGTTRGKSINQDWMTEQTRDWDMIKPISAEYLTFLTASVPLTGSPTMVSVSSAIPPTPNPVPTPADDPTQTPRHRAIFSQAMRILNPPGPANLSGANINASGSGTGDAHISMVGLEEKRISPSLMTVAVLIAMPAPPTSSSSTSLSAAAPLSASVSTDASSSSSASPPPRIYLTSPSSLISPSTTVTRSHPLQINPTFPLPLPSTKNEEEQRIPHIEVGVAEVLVVSPDSVTQDEGVREHRKLRESIGSRDSMASEV